MRPAPLGTLADIAGRRFLLSASRSVRPRSFDGPVGPRGRGRALAFLKHVSELLEENGEYVDAQALTPARTQP